MAGLRLYPASRKTPLRRVRPRCLSRCLTVLAALAGLAACWGPPESTVINNLFDAAIRRPVRSYFYSPPQRAEILLARQFPAGSPASALTDYIESVGGACSTRSPAAIEIRFERIHCTYQNVTYSVREKSYFSQYYESLDTWLVEIDVEYGNIVNKIVNIRGKSEILTEQEYLHRLRIQTETGSSLWGGPLTNQ